MERQCASPASICLNGAPVKYLCIAMGQSAGQMVCSPQQKLALVETAQLQLVR